MLSWCSYCQQFMGEVPPYEDLVINHGMCAACEANELGSAATDLRRANFLNDIQHQLAAAGKHNDIEEAERVIDVAIRAKVMAIDILIGIIAPLLREIGDDWKRNRVCVAQEHRFTAFCERIFSFLAAKVGDATSAAPATSADRAEVLLMNAPGNRHMLAVRILSLWLKKKGVPARLVDRPQSAKELVALINRTKPKQLLISMALSEQAEGVAAIAEQIAALQASTRPKVIVGGNAVKLGLVPAIPDATLLADINAL